MKFFRRCKLRFSNYRQKINLGIEELRDLGIEELQPSQNDVV
jgi:hypothetical protein